MIYKDVISPKIPAPNIISIPMLGRDNTNLDEDLREHVISTAIFYANVCFVPNK